MADHDDIINRLLRIADREWQCRSALIEAADAIERLRAALEEARATGENVVIAYSMGWDMDGVIEVAMATLATIEAALTSTEGPRDE